jgi:spore coat polysaccharide biosynthesis protein SpsF
VTGAIVQARMGSSRLPGKVLLAGVGKPLLGHLLERLRKCQNLDLVVVATSHHSRDDVIADYCYQVGTPVFRGSEEDVLDRYYRAARHFGLKTIVRVTSDCPLIDPTLIDEQLRFFSYRRHEFELVTNRHPLTYPDGLDFDIMPMEALEFAWHHAVEPQHREHTVPYFWDTGMRVHNFEDPHKFFFKHRWTLDYPEDYKLINTILNGLYPGNHVFTTEDILEFLRQNPELPLLNAHYIR